VTALAYAGEKGQVLVTGHAKAVLRVVDAHSGRLIATLRGPEAQISQLVSSPDGKRLGVLSQDRSISVFDLETRAARFQVEGHRTKQTMSLAFFADSRLAASVALDNSVQLWDTNAPAALATLWGQAGESYAFVALPKSGGMAAALSDGRIRLWGRAG
jgi:WD40 repeat protein